MGGWISTRASGMKKNKYGNIEDITVGIKFVTPQGTIAPPGLWPRYSSGPDMKHMIMGHEGNLGVVTEAIFKIKKKPDVQRYGSILFPNFEAGIKFMNEVGFSSTRPASVRLVDNMQFLFGRALQPDVDSIIQKILNAAKKFFILNVKGFKGDQMCAATMVFEGTEEEVQYQENFIYTVASKFGGYNAG